MEDEEYKHDKETKSTVREWIKLTLLIVLALGLALIIKGTFGFIGNIPSESMKNTLNIHDKVLVNRLAYRNDDPQIGDIVVFKETHTNQICIKRVIAKGGSTVVFNEGNVYVDGKLISEDYVTGKSYFPEEGVAGVTVPEGKYFVMGDNRENSLDSRYFGSIDKEYILGKAEYKIYPFNDITKF